MRYLAGILLIVIGAVSLLAGGFRWNDRRNVVRAGGFEVQTQERHAIPIPRPLGALALVAGMFVLVTAKRGA